MKIVPPKFEGFSPVKWQREQKLLKSMRLLNDRASLPVLNREDIIAYRLPFHEAIIRKLDKNGFQNSAEYMKQLISFQDAYRNAAGEESIIWQRPRLLYQQNILEDLANGLQKAEEAHIAERIDTEVDEILKLAIEYCFGIEHWWWLGHQLLFIILKSSDEYKEDRGIRKSLVRYVFGRFLVQNAKEPSMALEHLKIARRTSAGMSWNINLVFKKEYNTIFSDTCRLIYQVRIFEAKSVMQKEPKLSIKLCEKARKRALEGCFYEGIIEAYLIKGSSQMMIFDTDNAINSYLKGLDILEEHPYVELKCDTLRNLAMAYIKHGSLNSALRTLHKLKEYSQQNNKMLYVAQAHKYLGEYYLREGTARNATPLLMTAVKLFHAAGDIAETSKTRNLAAISVGIELMPVFSEIIKNSDPKFSNAHSGNLRKLVRWKDMRDSFWTQSQAARVSAVSIHTVGAMSGRTTDIVRSEDEEEDFSAVEELLRVTGLEEEYTVETNTVSPSNITEVISIPGVVSSDNTIQPPSTFANEVDTNVISYVEKETSSFSAYETSSPQQDKNS